MNSPMKIGPRQLAEIGRRGQLVDPLAGGDVDPDTGRLLSIAQLQAVLRRSADTANPSVPGPHLGTGSTDAAAFAASSRPSWLLVLAAQAGIGCSTTALAIADAAAIEWPAVHLIEAGHAGRSGLGAVTTQELGVGAGGWRRGRRGGVILDRPSGIGARSDPPEPCLPVRSERGGLLTIVDGGFGWADPPDGRPDTWWRTWWPTPPAAVVVVCQASVPGVEGAERVLTQICNEAAVGYAENRLNGHGGHGRDTAIENLRGGGAAAISHGGAVRLAVASVGGSRWGGPVLAACGPQLRKLHLQHLVVGVPQVRRLKVSGPTADPLPRSMMTAGRKLWLLTAPDIESANRAATAGGRQ